jgi:hypothetical protein
VETQTRSVVISDLRARILPIVIPFSSHKRSVGTACQAGASKFTTTIMIYIQTCPRYVPVRTGGSIGI